MKKKFLKSMLASVLAAAMLLTAVPAAAAEPTGSETVPEAVIASTEATKEEIYLEVKMETLKAIDSCQPTSISTGLDENEYWILTPGYSIEAHELPLYVECPHGVNEIYITDAMCSYYQSDWLNSFLPIKVTYKGIQVPLTVVYQYPTYDFVDISLSDWFYSSVDFVYESLYMTGLDLKHFGPYQSLSRAQFATILYRMEREPEYTTTKTFPDVEAGSWYEDAVKWAYENGIITGYQNGKFGPADLITRDQMAVMMYRYADYLGFEANNKANLSSFVDGSHVPSYAKDAMAWVVAEGIITGKDNGTRLAPLENTARAECAAIVDRFVDWAVYR